jgi:DNA-binding transcriptional regulator/RsmH inhibitor MraZ
VAGNYDHLQLWNPTAWEQHLHAVEGSAEHAAERLAARGL